MSTSTSRNPKSPDAPPPALGDQPFYDIAETIRVARSLALLAARRCGAHA